MNHPSKLLLIASIVCLGAIVYAAPRPAAPSAGFQMGYGQGGGQTFTCSSDDGKRNYCNADIRNGVQLTRQISGSPCIQGQTWGYDNRGLWVDRGCRAEFVAGGYGGGQGPGYGPGGGVRLTCSSDNGKRNWCDIGGNRDVRLTRQISGSPCIEGQTWGTDRRGLWVDRGCRAEFFTRQNRAPAQIVTCSSNNGRRNWCSINGRDVRLTRQISGSPCVQGQTWDVDRRGLWVDRGCRAEFQVR